MLGVWYGRSRSNPINTNFRKTLQQIKDSSEAQYHKTNVCM